MNYFIFGASALVAVIMLMRSNIAKAAVDNVKISTGLTEKTENISMSDDTIAARNNNPVNIRVSSDNWVGLANPRSKQGFFNFTDVRYCYRASAIIILKSYAARGVRTLSQVITTWAPPSENKTEKYIDFVVSKSGLSRDAVINKSNIAKLLYGMTIIESGKAQPMNVIESGVALAQL